MKYLCRFCAEKHENLQTIFQDAKVKDIISRSPENVAKQIFRDIEFRSDGQLPNAICQLCLNTLKLSYDFYNKIKKSQYKLNEILNQQKQNQNKKIFPILLPKENENSIPQRKLIQPRSDNKRIYQCFECSDNFKSLRKLNGHIMELHTTKNICIYCNCYYPENEIINHIKTDHINSNFFCILCSKNFSTQRFFFKHLKKAHNYQSGCFYCTKCDYLQFTIRENLLKHLNDVHSTDLKDILPKPTQNYIDIVKNEIDLRSTNENKFIKATQDELIMDVEFLDDFLLNQDENSYQFKDSSNNVVDIVKNEIELHSNNQNEFVTATQDELIMDVEFLDDFFLNQDENSFQFNDCWEALGLNFEDELKFSDLTNESFVGATISESIKNENLYKCPRCYIEFSSQFKLFIHLAHIHNENCLVCNECSLKFSKFNEFVQHKKTHFRKYLLNQQKDEPLQRIKNKKIVYECKNCKKIYNLKNNYLIHICSKSNSSNLQKLTCNFCNLNFPNIKEIYAHQKLEHINRTLQCTVCDKDFKTLPGLKYHLKTHEGIKSFVCPYCNQKFLANVNLRAHIKAVHAIKKSHLCDLCDRRFATLDHLKKHVMSVHQKERNHLCSVCGSCFSQVSHLKQHSEIHKEKKTK